MLFEKHNFDMNYFNAEGSKDKELSTEIIFDEISKLIISKPTEISDSIRAAGIDIPSKPSQTQLVEILTENLGRNKTLAKNIAMLMLESGQLSADGHYNQAGKLKGLGEKLKKIDMSKVLSIGKSIFGVFGGKKKRAKEEAARRLAEARTERQRERARKALLAKMAARKPAKGLSTGAIAAMIGGAVLLFGTIAFFILRGKKAQAAAPSPEPAVA